MIFMHSLPDSVGEGIIFSGCPSAAFIRSFVRLSGQILLPQYHTKNDFDKNKREYSLARTDDRIRFWRSEVKGQGYSSHRGVEGIHVEAGAFATIF